jgi:hypothetical protein
MLVLVIRSPIAYVMVLCLHIVGLFGSIDGHFLLQINAGQGPQNPTQIRPPQSPSDAVVSRNQFVAGQQS